MYSVNLPLKEKLHRVEDHNFKYLYEKEPVCNGKIVCPCRAVTGRFHFTNYPNFPLCLDEVTIFFRV